MALTRLFVHPIEPLLLVERNVGSQYIESIQDLVQIRGQDGANRSSARRDPSGGIVAIGNGLAATVVGRQVVWK